MTALTTQKLEKLKEALYWPDATFDQAMDFYQDIVTDPGCTDTHLRILGQVDRYFLLIYLLKRADAVHPWLYARCREVEQDTDGYLDLWAREHYKSTIITYAGTIQEILNDPDVTIGIFSHTRPIAKAFLNQIKQELERNETLLRVYHDILWLEPKREAPVWSLDSGITVRRNTNPKEQTVEAWGLVDGQPVSKHFKILIFDDVVTLASVTTADQIHKTTEAWELAQHLGSGESPRKWHVGTRYNLADSYDTLLKREALIPRVYPATHDGTPDGEPVFLTPKAWEKKKRESSGYTIACQMLQNPAVGTQQEFKPDWIRTYETRPHTLNVYILGDYAGSRKSTGSSKTAIIVIGVDSRLNKYLLDGVCHKLGLADRWKVLKKFWGKWSRAPGVRSCQVGYERFGAQSDLEHFEEMMKREDFYFPIQEVNYPRDGVIDKDNRIRRLIPDFQNWRFFLPYEGAETSRQREAKEMGEGHLLARPIKQVNEEQRVYNLVHWFIENEFNYFPNTIQKDMLDAMSRLYDMDYCGPTVYFDSDVLPEPD